MSCTGQHAYTVFRRCRRLLNDEAEARDMVQEVFMRALENPEAFRGRSSASTFFFGVATNLCLNRLRSRLARDDAWQRAVATAIEAHAPSAPDAKVASEQVVSLVLSDADEVTVAIALYHWVDGLSQGEIAELVGLSRVTVNQRLQRLRAKARTLGEAC
jgi:RNA polymerase sigma factor (sigma-70 family)